MIELTNKQLDTLYKTIGAGYSSFIVTDTEENPAKFYWDLVQSGLAVDVSEDFEEQIGQLKEQLPGSRVSIIALTVGTVALFANSENREVN